MKNLRRIFQPNNFPKREDSWARSPIHPLCGSELSSSYLCLLRYFLQFLVWRPAFPWCLQPHCGSFIHPQPMQNVLGCLCIFAWLNIKLVYLSSPLGALAWLPKRNNHLFPHGYSLVHGPVSFSLQHLHYLKLPHWFVGRLSFHLTTSAHIYMHSLSLLPHLVLRRDPAPLTPRTRLRSIWPSGRSPRPSIIILLNFPFLSFPSTQTLSG